MSAIPNPITQGYQAILGAMRAWSNLTPTIIAPANLIDITTAVGAQRYIQTLNQKDDGRPALTLTEGKVNIATFASNSLGVRFGATYPGLVLTADFTINTLNLILFEVGRALTAVDSQGQLNVPTIIEKYDIMGLPSMQTPIVNRPCWIASFNVNVTFSMTRAYYLQTTFS